MRSPQIISSAAVLLTTFAALMGCSASPSVAPSTQQAPEALFRGTTLGEYIAKKLGGKPAEEKLRQGLADSRLAYMPVLVLLGSGQGKAVRQFFQLEYDNLGLGFLHVAIDVKEPGEVVAKHGIAMPAEDDATLAILNSDGSIVAQASFAELMNGVGVKEFLKDRGPPLPNAGQELAGAVAEAARDDKRVLVQMGAPWCDWCVVLSRFLEAHKDLISKDYVHVHLDERMADAQKIVEGLGKKSGDGLPWMVILNAEGRPLITSNAEGGNIGYPGDEGGRAHFDKMMRTTRKRLTDDDLAALRKAVEGAAAK